MIVQGKSSGNNLISVTFVEVQLGSGEDQRVSAHQLHCRFGNMFLFWLAHVQNGASQDKSNDEFSLVLKHRSLHSESNQWLMVWTGRRGSRAKQKRRFRIPSCAAVSPYPTQNRGYNKYCISTRKPRNMEFIDARNWTRACQGNHRNPPLLTVKKLLLLFSRPPINCGLPRSQQANPNEFIIPVSNPRKDRQGFGHHQLDQAKSQDPRRPQ